MSTPFSASIRHFSIDRRAVCFALYKRRGLIRRLSEKNELTVTWMLHVNPAYFVADAHCIEDFEIGRAESPASHVKVTTILYQAG